MTVFVATTQDRLISLLNDRYTILHPLYNWTSPLGVAVLESMGATHAALPIDPNKWNQMLLRDYWAIKNSNLLVYDLDKGPGEHHLAAALIHNIPVIAVSENFVGLPFQHFSGLVSAIIKPNELQHLTKLVESLDIPV